MGEFDELVEIPKGAYLRIHTYVFVLSYFIVTGSRAS